MITIYKIRDTNSGLYSHGIIHTNGSKRRNAVVVKWSKKGKEWTSEKLVKDHLLKCIAFGGIPTHWEIIEFTQQPSRSLHEWIDANMLVKILKVNHTNNQ